MDQLSCVIYFFFCSHFDYEIKKQNEHRAQSRCTTSLVYVQTDPLTIKKHCHQNKSFFKACVL